MRLKSSIAVVMISLAALDAEAQEGAPSLQVAMMQAECGRTVSEAVAALPTLRRALEACRPSAERTCPHARVVAQLSLNKQVASQMRFEAAAETTMAAFAWVLRPPPISSVPTPTAPPR